MFQYCSDYTIMDFGWLFVGFSFLFIGVLGLKQAHLHDTFVAQTFYFILFLMMIIYGAGIMVYGTFAQSIRDFSESNRLSSDKSSLTQPSKATNEESSHKASPTTTPITGDENPESKKTANQTPAEITPVNAEYGVNSASKNNDSVDFTRGLFLFITHPRVASFIGILIGILSLVLTYLQGEKK